MQAQRQRPRDGIQQIVGQVEELQLLQGLEVEWGEGREKGCGRLAGGRGPWQKRVPDMTPFIRSGLPEPQPCTEVHAGSDRLCPGS